MRRPAAERCVKLPNDPRFHPFLPPYTPTVRSPRLTHHNRLRTILSAPIQASPGIRSSPAGDRHGIRLPGIQLPHDTSPHLTKRNPFKNPIWKHRHPLTSPLFSRQALPVISRIRASDFKSRYPPAERHQNLTSRTQSRQVIWSEPRKMNSQAHELNGFIVMKVSTPTESCKAGLSAN